VQAHEPGDAEHDDNRDHHSYDLLHAPALMTDQRCALTPKYASRSQRVTRVVPAGRQRGRRRKGRVSRSPSNPYLANPSKPFSPGRRSGPMLSGGMAAGGGTWS
jgi:hypothetical protein